MKNNNITYLGLFALLILSMMACTDEYLDKLPLDEISSAVYFKHASDFELYANQFYPKTFDDFTDGDPNNGWNQGIWGIETNSDNMIADWGPDDRLNGNNTVPPSGGGWDHAYSIIRDVNYGLENKNKCEDDPEEYNQYVGELYYFRAAAYFELVKSFGDVPWVDKTLTPESEELYAKRNPRSEIVDHILSDLDSAALLMNSGKNQNGTRLSKEVAWAFKSRVALYEGTWEKYHQNDVFKGSTDGTGYLQAAVEAVKKVMDSGIYSIYSTGDKMQDYFDLTVQIDYSGIDEVILWKKYDLDLNFVHHHSVASRRASHRGVTRELAASYLTLNGMPRDVDPAFDEQSCDTTGLYEANNLDPRFYQSIASPNAIWAIDGDDVITWGDNRGGSPMSKWIPQVIDGHWGWTTPTGYTKRKGFSPQIEIWKGWANENFGTVFMRYAEVLLNYAEAKAELGTISQTDIDQTINILRDRVGMPHLDMGSITTDPNWDFPSLSPIINEVRRERRVELAFEGFRLDDILRWAAADELIKGKRFKGVLYNNGDSRVPVDGNGYVDRFADIIPQGYGFDLGRDYLNAIPIEQITLNPNIEQNPGW